MRRARAARGFTLLEALLAAALVSVVIAGAASALTFAAVHHRNGALLADAQEEGRSALDAVSNDLLDSSLGGQLIVNQAGTLRRVSQVHGSTQAAGTAQLCGRAVSGTTSTAVADVFVVRTSRAAAFDAAVMPVEGARSWVTASASPGSGSLTVDSIAGLAAEGNTLLLTDLQSSALVTRASAVGTTVTSQDLAVPGFSTDPLGARPIRAGTAVIPARVVHYYLCPEAAGGTLALYRSTPAVCSSGVADPNPVFCDEYNSSLGAAGAVVARGVRGMRVSYGLDRSGSAESAALEWVDGLAPGGADGAFLREVRLELTAVTTRDVLDSEGRPIAGPRPERRYETTIGLRNRMLKGNY